VWPQPAPQQDTASESQGGLLGRLPAKTTLDYTKVAIEVLLLLLAVPWILRELVKNPGRVSQRAATKHLSGGGGS
jgi:hypothetical protein